MKSVYSYTTHLVEMSIALSLLPTLDSYIDDKQKKIDSISLRLTLKLEHIIHNFVA